MTATLLTVGQLREHLETDLSDEALQRILDAEEAEIVARYGAHSSASEMLPGGGEWLVLERTPASITSVTEIVGDTTTTLATDDYRVWPRGQLERLATGTNGASYWGDVVTVVYVPEDANARRSGVLIKLATLGVRFTGVKQESVGAGDHSETALDFTLERERLLRSLAPKGALWVV